MARQDGSDFVDIYLRQSQDRTGQGGTVPHARQEKECRALAKQRGLTVRHVFRDTESATDPRKTRPGFEDLLKSRPAAIITWHEDRLIRTTRDLERVIELGIDVYVVKHGRLELSTPTGRAVARTVVAWAQHETEHKAQRQRAANLQRAELGIPWKSGQRMFGFTQDRREFVDTEAELVRKAFQDVLAGVSVRAILRRWKAAGVRTSTGVPFANRTFMDMLRRPAYAGRNTYQGVDVGPMLDRDGRPMTPMVDPEVWHAVQVLISDPSRRTTDNMGRGPIHLLSGIARCGVCGAKMLSGVGRRNGVGSSRYVTLKCTATRHLERKADDIEDYVIEVVLARLRRPDARALFEAERPDTGPLRSRAAELRSQREALAADLTVDLQFAAARDRRLREELERIEEEIAAKSSGSALAPFSSGRDPGAVWAGLDLDAKRAVIRELVDVVVLSPRRMGRQPFDPSTVRVTPRRAP